MRNLLFLTVGLAGSAFAAAEQKIGIDDAQIAHVAVSANDVTVEASRLARGLNRPARKSRHSLIKSHVSTRM